MHPLVQFWLVVLSLIAGVAALGYLSMSFVFSGTPVFATGPIPRLAAAVVALAAMGVVVWSAVTFGDVVSEGSGRQSDR